MASPALFPGRVKPQTVGLLSAALPSPMGDAVGLLADGMGYAEDPKSLTLGSGLLSLAGMIPGVPSSSVFRAVGPDELAAIRKSGKIKSNLTMALPVEKHFGLTGFAGSSDEASMYAKANLGNSGEAYLLEVKKTPDMRQDYPSLPKMAKRLDELSEEVGTLQKTISSGKVPAGMDKAYADWLDESSREMQEISGILQSTGVPLDKIRSAPGSASLPYWMTPNEVPAENIQRVFSVDSGGKLKKFKWP